MKFVIVRQNHDQGNQLEVELQHAGRSVPWAYSIPTSRNNQVRQESKPSVPRLTPHALYQPINDFFEYLPPTTQEAIFSVYDRMRGAFYHPGQTVNLSAHLTPLVAELYRHIRLEDISNWAKMTGRIVVPMDAPMEFTESGVSSNTRELTYTYADYWQLLCLSIALRALLPMWGQFIDYTSKDVGTNWKEAPAYQLLARSDLWECEPVQRLRGYVVKRYEKSTPKDMHPAILDSISSEEIPEWLMGLVLVRKVSVSEVDYSRESITLLQVIWNFVNEKVSRSQTFFKGFLHSKDTKAGNIDDDAKGKNSLLEAYKMPVEITTGDQSQLNAGARNVDLLIQQVAWDVPRHIMRQALSNAQQVLSKRRLYPVMRAITNMVLKDALPVLSGDFIEREYMIGPIGVAQGILWHRGHKEIAALLTAVPYTRDGVLDIGASTTRTRLSKELVEKLNDLYPYSRVKNGKDSTSRHTNDGIVAIDTLIEHLDMHTWHLMIPPSWMKELAGEDTPAYRMHAIPPDIKNKLALLAIDMDQWGLNPHLPNVAIS